MDNGNARQQIVESIKSSTNILVTVSTDPSVDELSAALGLTILLNKLEKRATAVVSGEIPPAITFLDPGKTFESTVNSLRDFIIALDKEKADHLRYKIDGDVVKIFITPYRTTLTNKDLDFSQGDYNVEMVIALGVKDQDHLDKALMAHGRILHDATVATITAGPTGSALGSIDWFDPAASGLSEMLVGLSEALKTDAPILDEQTATALLTGIVSATDRFSNDRTSSRVMTMAAQLMAAGANQQLIAAKLEEAHEIGPKSTPKKPQAENSDGTISLNDDQSTRLDNGNNRKKNDKKNKRQDNAIQIDRTKESDIPAAPIVAEVPPVEPTGDTTSTNDSQQQQAPSIDLDAIIAQVPPAPEPAPQVDEQAAIQEAIESAAPAVDAEQELARKLSEVVTPEAAAPTTQDIQSELTNSILTDPQPDAQMTDSGMPGFEQTDLAGPSQQAPVLPPASTSIVNHSSSGYVHAEDQAQYSGQITGTEPDRPEGMIAKVPTIDPFSNPLPPLDTSSQSTSPLDQSVFDQLDENAAAPSEAPNVVANEAFTPPPPVAELQTASVQAAAPIELPPLPPMPDFSTLPPLPALPSFDSPMPQSPSGGMSSDQLGNIFGDTPALPSIPDSEPAKPTTPPEPGQFRIPGQ